MTEEEIKIAEMQIVIFKYQQIIKLLLVTNLDTIEKRHVCETFDACITKNQIEDVYLKFLNEYKLKCQIKKD